MDTSGITISFQDGSTRLVSSNRQSAPPLRVASCTAVISDMDGKELARFDLWGYSDDDHAYDMALALYQHSLAGDESSAITVCPRDRVAIVIGGRRVKRVALDDAQTIRELERGEDVKIVRSLKTGDDGKTTGSLKNGKGEE